MAFGDHTLIDEQFGTTGATETLVVPAGGVPANSLIVVVASARGALADVNLAVADDASNTYTARLLDASTNMNGAVWWCAGCSALAENDTIVVSGMIDDNRAVRAYWFEGVATSDALEDSSQNSATSGTTYNAGSVTTPDAEEYLLLGLLPIARHPEGSFTEEPDWTTIGSPIGTSITDNGVDRSVRMAKRVVSAAGDYEYSPTGEISIWTIHNLAFKKAASGSQTVAIGLVTETETAQALVQDQTVSIGLATESESVSAISPAGSITIENDFEEASIDLANSSVTGVGDSAVITIKPLTQASEVTSNVQKWLNPYFRVKGVNGFRPTFKILDHNNSTGGYWGYAHQTSRRYEFSLDRETWTAIDTNHTIGTEIEFRHSTAFAAGSELYVAWSPRLSVTQFGQWLEDLATAHPTMVLPTSASLDPVPSELSSWPAQDFIVGMYSAQTFGGKTSPELPLYAAWIDDPALQPASGSKRTVACTFGNHAGEPLGDIIGCGSIEFLCSSDTQAQNVRQHARVLVLGLMNAPGRYLGAWRGSPEDGPGGIDDANRNFEGTSADTGLEIVDIPMQVLIDVLPEVVQASFDFHGAYSTKFGIYTDITAQDDFLTAMDPYVTPAISDKGGSATGDVQDWFRTEYGTAIPITYETGNTTPITSGQQTEWQEALWRALSDMIAAGDVPLVVEIGLATETESVQSIAADTAGTTAVAVGLASETETVPGVLGHKRAFRLGVAAEAGFAHAMTSDGGIPAIVPFTARASMMANVGTLMNR